MRYVCYKNVARVAVGAQLSETRGIGILQLLCRDAGDGVAQHRQIAHHRRQLYDQCKVFDAIGAGACCGGGLAGCCVAIGMIMRACWFPEAGRHLARCEQTAPAFRDLISGRMHTSFSKAHMNFKSRMHHNLQSHLTAYLVSSRINPRRVDCCLA